MESNDPHSITDFVQACHTVSSLPDFRSTIYDQLQRLIPHAMFAFGTVCLSNLILKQSLNINFPNEYLGPNVSQTCPEIRQWVREERPLYVAQGQGHSNTAAASSLARYKIRNLAVHGVTELNRRQACLFLFGGVDVFRDEVENKLQLLIPHLYFALAKIGDFDRAPGRGLLTKREAEILEWICIGKSNSEIGMILGISPWTVKVHVSKTIEKLNASNRCHAIAIAMHQGLIEV
ncbi:helix-turn-helix transcriptional regulator [Marinobacter zhejiangensis]|uniref:Transcriptional regulator, LuxR family n=1 Tax=Marinobacter zhejiangensis TaxID=488535 RepID=A0A1I4TME6_9GAMM|nr:helix-turn-helix transcriptional regulator [Marinobacter zhejiangensis]SFM77914.1 transcriptional regulator, LuxR family [Marinobacter zhejiangensis]